MTNRNQLLALLTIAALGLSACASEDYDRGNAAQGSAPNLKAPAVAESACLAAVNSQYSGVEGKLRVIRSNTSPVISEVIVQANNQRWRCMVLNDGNVRELNKIGGG